MYLAAPLRQGLRLVLPVLLPIALASTIWLYLYPVFQNCAFPLPPYSTLNLSSSSPSAAAFLDTATRHVPSLGLADPVPRAPFRLLALGDPQLEGDTSIPNLYLGVVPHLKSLYRHATFRTAHSSLRQRIRQICHDLVDFYLEDIPNELESVRKRIDHFGNDFYLAHIYRTLDWWAVPTHATVLGDLVGSQWISDAEFRRRGNRFWNRVFRGTERVADDLAAYPDDEYDLAAILDPTDSDAANDTDLSAWRRRLINVAGNHDIGYAGDLTPARLARFERVFGKANYELRFELPLSDPTLLETLYDPDANPTSTRLMPELRVVVSNDMNLDTPAFSGPLQDDTYAFINKVINTGAAVEFSGHFTVVLTHIPFYKPAGTCVDKPYFDFFPSAEGGGVREQNMLSQDASRGFLEGIYGMSGNKKAAGRGMGRKGVVLNGHDHAGCDTYHFINQTNGTRASERKWEARRWLDAKEAGVVGKEGHPGIREITVRSMMGDFHGNAGLLSAWFDEAAWEWKVEYVACRLGTQHGWWAVHILDLVGVVGLVVWGVMIALGLGVDGGETAQAKGGEGKTVRAKEESVPVKGEAARVKGETGRTRQSLQAKPDPKARLRDTTQTMNPELLLLACLAAAATALTLGLEPRLDLFIPVPANKTAACPSARPETCDCEKFREKDDAKYFQCATDPFCEHCSGRWTV
ncbi:related to cell division control protein/predicted DNA repair exonuclease [Cephalotrichum gorgonifer]|uniref:Related to cell division control protein/predicted DNA repair exonuclease n=1 Tax=Cephalotrichum gorgonifer TaxID=2041049 RepID=A0AAE8N0J1_9PEZI|nr:related to cell division control protein/predicted DNA repair exonuclease [Cephalotrichum gorgonifer]